MGNPWVLDGFEIPPTPVKEWQAMILDQGPVETVHFSDLDGDDGSFLRCEDPDAEERARRWTQFLG